LRRMASYSLLTAMENNGLTPQQRENIRNHLVRRVSKMDDAALLQFERATRRRSPGPAPAVEKQPGAEEAAFEGGENRSPASGIDSEAVALAVGEMNAEEKDEAQTAAGAKKIDRRQAITYGVTGALALIAASTGIGWGKSLREGEQLRKEGEETRASFQVQLDALREKVASLKDDHFDSSLRYTLEEINAGLDELVKRTGELADKKDASAEVIESYRAGQLSRSLESMTHLKDATNHVNDLYNVPYVAEAMGVFIYMLETKDLKSYYAFFKAYEQQAPTIAEIFDFLPGLFQANKDAVAALDPWLNPESGIDAQLLKPLEEELFHAFDSSSRQAKSVQKLAEEKLTPAVEQFLDQRDQFFDALGES